MATRQESVQRKAKLSHDLRESCRRGEWAPGEPVPSTTELVRRYGLSARTVHREVAKLIESGVLYAVPRVGTFVSFPKEARTAPEAEGGLMQHTIAVLTLDEGRVAAHHRQPGWAEYITQGVLDGTQNSGFHAMVLSARRLRGSNIERLLKDPPRGVILTETLHCPEEAQQVLMRLQGVGVPVVVYSDAPDFANYDRVASDHAAGAYELTRWLLSQGRTRILPFWPAPLDRYWLQGRQKGYERAMREAGLQPLAPVAVPHPVEPPANREEFDALARHICGYLVEHLVGVAPVDALMLASDGYVPCTAAACRLFGKTPNTDVAIVGYDNYWAEMPERQWEPTVPMATIDKGNRRLGEELSALLAARISGELPSMPQRRTLLPELCPVDSNPSQS